MTHYVTVMFIRHGKWGVLHGTYGCLETPKGLWNESGSGLTSDAI